MEELPGLYFMRARYYSVDAGVFLSTDPLKPIGPNWRPQQYWYTDRNPIDYMDPNGEIPVLVLLELYDLFNRRRGRPRPQYS